MGELDHLRIEPIPRRVRGIFRGPWSWPPMVWADLATRSFFIPTHVAGGSITVPFPTERRRTMILFITDDASSVAGLAG